MSEESIAFLISGIVCTLGLLGAILGYGWRRQHPYTTMDLERSNWFTRWIKSNFNMFMWLLMLIILITTIAFFTMFASSLHN